MRKQELEESQIGTRLETDAPPSGGFGGSGKLLRRMIWGRDREKKEIAAVNSRLSVSAHTGQAQ